jgi:hypothetical protein
MYTTQKLITESFYLSNIVSRDLETISQSQLQDGLFRLNGFLAMKGANTKLIPYYRVVQDNFIAGQEKYFIPGLVEIETLTFFLPNANNTNSVRFPMWERTRYDYFGSARAEQIKALPYQWELERVYGGANLYIYNLPQQDYPYELVGKYLLTQTVLNQDLSVVYDDFYIEYLLYGLAKYLCGYYDIDPPRHVEQQLKEMENYLRTLSPMDLSMRKLQAFTAQPGPDYAQANIGRGFTRA